ncbi:MAG: RcpC/CpaB family pilus assembly protein [Kineosporiaceae bacterium]
MGRRTLLLIASILVAALGTALVWLYVQGADSRATAGEVQVPVLVSENQVSAGAPASAVQPLVKRLPQSLVSAFPGVITDRAQIHGYARTDVVPGMPLMTDQFGASAPVPQPPVQLNPRLLAMQVSLPDPQRLAGLLQPGAQIRIYLAPATSRGAAEPQVLLNKVKVLASGPVTQPDGTAPAKGQIPQAIVTLEVTNPQAIKLVAAQAQGGGGGLWFGLLGDQTPSVLDSMGAGG